jgi:hypothetical protein
MSKKSSSPDSAATPAGESPRGSRISNPRPKKSAKSARPPQDPAKDESAADKPAAVYPVFDLSGQSATPPPVAEEPAPAGDWPEPESASSGETPAAEGSKRNKRRRKKGKGGQQNAAQPGSGESPPSADAGALVVEPASPAHQARPSHPPRPKVDSEMLAKLAWKIYLAEVSEEGVALIGDNDAKELSRRCFRLAEIFMEEQTRRR